MVDILERLKASSKVNGAYPQDIADAIKEIEKLRSIPMKYRRMEFNAKLQKELDEAYREIERLKERESAYLWDKYPDRMGGAFTQDEINESGTWK